MPLFASAEVHPINLNERVFERFPNAKRIGVKSPDLSHLIVILCCMTIFSPKHAVMLDPDVQQMRKKSHSGVFNHPNLGAKKLLGKFGTLSK